MCHKEVGVYQQIFSTSGETALIERTERRYAWLRRRLRAKAEIWAIFPEAWRLPQRMCLLFAQVTRTHLAEILDNKVSVFCTYSTHSLTHSHSLIDTQRQECGSTSCIPGREGCLGRAVRCRYSYEHCDLVNITGKLP